MVGVAPEKEPRSLGRYALFGEIASGGMATVHLGRLLGPVGFSRTVAIKRLHAPYARDPELVSMFLDEARLAARIQHPNVVPTLDVVATPGELFLVMEYVQGESLWNLMKASAAEGQRVPLRIALSIASGMLQGLHAAHEARDERGVSLHLVHRDVSPQNVLVGVDGMARVLDFGVAMAKGRAQRTLEGAIKGKLAYVAPEQVREEPVGREADIYAAAVVLWEVLTGERLFRGDTEAAVLARVLAGDVKPPSSRAAGIAPELDAIVMRGLSASPADRFSTARAMALALDRCGAASLGEVAEWVAAVAGPSLARRAAMVAAVEASSSAPDGESLRSIAETISLGHGADILPSMAGAGGARGALSASAETPRPLIAPAAVSVSPPAPGGSRLRSRALVGVAAAGLIAAGWLVLARARGDAAGASGEVTAAPQPTETATAAAAPALATASALASAPAPTSSSAASAAPPVTLGAEPPRAAQPAASAPARAPAPVRPSVRAKPSPAMSPSKRSPFDLGDRD